MSTAEPAASASDAPQPRSRATRQRPQSKITLGIGSAIVIVMVLVSGSIGVSLLRNMATPMQPIDGAAAPTEVRLEQTHDEIYVHVAGEVNTPGLYRVAGDARVVDAVAAAGGTTPDADLKRINLARPLTDGEQLVVPAVGDEAVAAGQPGVASDGKVNLNTADAAALETLPRVGPALAARIIEWREANGVFRSVDDLLAVSGIGEKMLAGLRDKVTT